MGEQQLSVGGAPNQTDKHMIKYMKDERFFPDFGLANKMVPPRNIYGQQDEVYYDFPDAYKGSSSYLRTIIISQVLLPFSHAQVQHAGADHTVVQRQRHGAESSRGIRCAHI